MRIILNTHFHQTLIIFNKNKTFRASFNVIFNIYDVLRNSFLSSKMHISLKKKPRKELNELQ